MPRSRSSFKHCNWINRDLSAGVFMGLAAIALNTESASINSQLGREYPPSSRSSRMRSVV
eukprot:7985841-Lingulodinium_polyedra.AAC.1